MIYKNNIFIKYLNHINKILRDKLIKFEKNQSLLKIMNIAIHPGKPTEQSCYKKLNNYIYTQEYKNVQIYVDIYTLILYLNKIKPIENGQIDINLHLGIYVLQVWDIKNEKNYSLSFDLLSFLIRLLNNNCWQLPYFFPPKNITQLNLYGLTIEAKQLTGTKGWNPSIQAYAKDLHESSYDNEYPKNIELFLIKWDQCIRINKSIYPDHPTQEREIIIKEKISG